MPFNIFISVVKTIPGLLLMLAVSVLAKGSQDLGLPQWRGLENIFAEYPGTVWILDILHLNFILICIITGIFIRNLLGIPPIFMPGIKTSRLLIKVGVILLGSLYSLADLADLGLTAFLMVTIFIFAALLLTLHLGKRFDMTAASVAVLAAGTAVCGVTAIVATAPAVKAKPSDVVYSITTVLTVGLIFLFLFPPVGALLNLTPHQFGVWAGTGILNSGQVLAATLAFDQGYPGQSQISLKTGEIFNITRVLFLPFVVLLLAVYNNRREENGDYDLNTSFWNKFPLFIVGFLAVVVMTSFGMFGHISPPSPELKFLRTLFNWFFALGLTGLAMQISFSELRKAGGKPLLVGTTAAVIKALAALLVVLLFIRD